MELALYCPNYGYYETKIDIGQHGDFYTSASTGELFGQLLAFQFADWLAAEVRGRPPSRHEGDGSRINIVEAGAHNGKLAADILNWLKARHPQLFSELEYVILEPSLRRRGWQKETLKDFTNVRWLAAFPDARAQIPDSRFNGIVFSNELVDAFPIRRFGWDARNKTWFEWGVAVQNDKFVWAKIRNAEGGIRNSELEAVLPDNYTIETSPAAENWWREAAKSIGRGKLLTIDYGFTADELFSPARTNGTLRAYFKHHATEDPLANPGEQDLTAHVNFSTMQKAGENSGLKTEFIGSQTKFLMEILATVEKNNAFGKWTAKQTRQFQTLSHPEHLGRAFRVLVQSR